MTELMPLQLQAGGTLNPRRHIYIRRPHDELLLNLLLKGEYANVLTSRQMGKSSLMMRTALELQQRGIRSASIDLASALGSFRDAESYYLGLLVEIARKLDFAIDIGTWWRKFPNETFNQRLLRFVREPLAEYIDGPVVIFLDEIDSTLKLDFTDDLFTAIRGMYNERALTPAYEQTTFCLLGVATPNELIKDRRTTAYNVGRTLELDDFDPAMDDLTPIVRALNKDPKVGTSMLDRVLYWTGGHPYLTVKTCVELQHEGACSADGVDHYIEQSYCLLERLNSDVHFQQIRRFFAHRLSDSLATLSLYQRILEGTEVQDRTTLTHAELKLSGLVKRDAEGLLIVRNRIYQNLFDTKWVASSKPQRELARYRSRARTAIAASVIVIASAGALLGWLNSKEYPPGMAFKGLFAQLGIWPVVSPEMVQIPAGEFRMGDLSGEGQTDEQPVRTVLFSTPFEIGKYEVTFDEYDLFAAATGRDKPNDEGWGRGRRPVINITWEDALAYAQWLSERTGENYRLPTEAEWEYAARAGTQTPRFWPEANEGEPEPACRYASVFDKGNESQIKNRYSGITWQSFDCKEDFPFTAPVGSFAANNWQLHDMLGNVWEWNRDCYIGSYKGAPTDGSPRESNDGSGCSKRVLRGGSWFNEPRSVRSANRSRNTPVNRFNDIGFRLARTL